MYSKFLIARIGFFLPIVLAPVIIFFKYGAFLYPGDIIINILFALIIVISCNLLSQKKTGLILEIVGLIIFNVIIYIKLSHVYLYKSFFSTTSVYILLETNISETSSFLSNYLSLDLYLLALVLFSGTLLSSILMVIIFKKNEAHFFSQGFIFSITKFKIRYGHLLILVVLVFLVYSKYNTRRPFYFLPFTIAKGLVHYKEDLKAYHKLGSDKLGGDFSKVVQKSKNSEIYTLVIGESTTRHHMGLYGYSRETNPLLNKIKNEMIIYNDVISPHASTIASLSKVLTLGNYDNPEGKFDGSLIQLFNKAGFKTYWISSQKKSGIYDTFVTGISNSCDEKYFLSNYNEPPMDEEILIPLTKVLSQKEGKKLIIIHLLGTHSSYENRYPKKFDKFKLKPPTKFTNKEAYRNINQYDNAILYNDFVVDKIISKLKKQDVKSSLVYFSDHGEEVYQTLNAAGHWEENASQAMYDIPFMIWLSDKNDFDFRNLDFDVDRKYVVEDLIYTLADLAGIRFQEFDPTRSLINPNFKYRKRMISKNVNYDEVFEQE